MNCKAKGSRWAAIVRRIAGLLALQCASGVSVATVYTLEADGSGDFATIQDAICGATDGDVIVLSPGRYHGEGNRDIYFLGKAVIVQAAVSNPQSVVIDAEGSEQEPHCGFLFRSGEARGSVLFGVTVTGGWWEGDPFTYQDGAIYVDAGCSPSIVGCRIEGNHGGNGGGIFSWFSSPRVEGCQFVENSAGGSGGGMYSIGGAPEVVNCVFVGNTAHRGGGLGLDQTDGSVQSTIFAGNEAGSTGGAVWASNSAVTLTNCTLYANEAYYGNGIASVFYCNVELRNSLICFNRRPGHATHCEDQGTIHAQCTNVYGNMLGDWTSCLNGQEGVEGNVCSDPFLCSSDPIGDFDWSIRDDSPCAPDVSGCGVIGAEDIGCYGTPCERVTWGELKARFR